MNYGEVSAIINMDDIVDHITPDINRLATLAADAEMTNQFETIQSELEGVCKQYLKEYAKEYIDSLFNNGTDPYGDQWRSA